jgi:putative transposase
MIFDMVLARRRMVEEASGRSRRARLERVRGARPGLAIAPGDEGRTIPGEYRIVPDEGSAGGGNEDTPLVLPYYETEDWDD